MKTNRKKIITIILILCMSTVLGLSGCSNKEKNNTDKKINANVTTAPNTSGTTKVSIPAKRSSLTLTFSKNSGVYEGEFDLEITCDGDADIYYTTDGSDPSISATKTAYSDPIKITDRSNDANYVSAVDPITFDAAYVEVNSAGNGFESKVSAPSDQSVDKCTVIRAVAVDKEGLYTAVSSNTYFVGSMADHIAGIQESCKAAGTSLAVISLSINYEDLFNSTTGIYVKGDVYEKALKDYIASGEAMTKDTARDLAANYNQKGKEWERSIHMDFFESDGTTTTCELQQDCGVRIQGNYSRSDFQKGFRLFAREEYGSNNFNYAIFGEDLKNDAGDTITKFKSLTLRNGGNCSFTTKYSDTYWQSLIEDLDCDTQSSRPCVVYIDGEYWGLYVLQEDYSQDYFEDTHGVNKEDVVLYKGDAEDLALGYKLDLGDLPEGEQNESYYFQDLLDFFQSHKDLSKDADYQEFSKLVDIESVRDYYAVEVWINNKWDWPGKNWSLWKTINVDDSNPYADGKWRFIFYDVEFGGVMGADDAYANTIQEDNYEQYGLLDTSTKNVAVLIYAYLMSNEKFRNDFEESLQALSNNNFKYDTAIAALDTFKNTYSPLYDQFFMRYEGTGSTENSNNGGYASYKCIYDFLGLRADHIQPMLDFVNNHYSTK